MDYFNSQEGKALYSYPTGVTAQCNTNKSYHFWMAAYLSRQLVKEGYSPASASLATYAAEIVYQFNRNRGVFGTPFQAGANALNKSPFDPVINIMRADLAYAKAGADYGARSDQQKPISIDRNLIALMRQGPKSRGDLSESDALPAELQRYRRLIELLSPGALIAD